MYPCCVTVKNSHQEDNCQFQIFAVTKGKNYIKSSFFIIINSSSKKKINAVILGVSFGIVILIFTSLINWFIHRQFFKK